MRKLPILILLLVSNAIIAQERVFYGGFFPEFALSKGWTENLQTTFKIESQHIQYDDRIDEGNQWSYEHYRTDFQGFVAYKLNSFWKVSVGYQFRLEGNEGIDHHRSIQQIAYVQKYAGFRLAHRLRLDQTYSLNEGEKTEYRARYRPSLELPLSGQSIDPGEYYLIISNEVLYGVQSGESEIENRLVSSVGHYFNSKAKLEVGLDWRTDRFIGEGFRHRLWLKIGCYINL